jgi:hypothetical protein
MSPEERRAAVAAARGPRPAPRRPAARPVETPASGLIVPQQKLTDPRLPGVEITLELIDPATAELYLSKLPTSQSKIKQRSQSPKTIDRYTGDMASSQWLFIADVIRFNVDGELIDGQHRLQAIVHSGCSEFQLVARGIEREAFAVFDTGRARSFADALRSMGIGNTALVSSLTGRVFHWRRGNYGVANVPRVPNALYLGVPASPGKLLETFQELRDELQHAARRATSLRQQFAPKTAAPSVLAFAYVLFSRLDAERCELFFHELQYGPAQNFPEYPMRVLRERLKKHLPPATPGSPDWVWIHFFLTTWAKWCKGESMGALRTPPRASINFLSQPWDPHADERPEDWKILGGEVA